MIDFKHLDKDDRSRYCQAACDLESGNYLINYRDRSELLAIQDVIDARNTKNPTEKQLEILEWTKACSDYDYANEHGYLDENGKFII